MKNAARNNNIKNKNVLILLSGGIDSTCCVQYYIENCFHVSALFIDYGQISAKKEFHAASQVSEFYNIPLSIVKSNSKKRITGKIPGRNSLLLDFALMHFPYSHGLVALGIHSGTNYPDCTEYFINIAQKIYDIYTDGLIRIDTPFLNWTKVDIWKYFNEKGLHIDKTYSCELGNKQPCGKCISCKDLELLYALS